MPVKKMKEREIPAYQGKEIKIKVKDKATGRTKVIRGAQNLNDTSERAETRVSEMGYDASKVVLSQANYSVSLTLVVRDLVQIARLSGLNVATSKRLVLTEFQPVNITQHFEDPDTDIVNFTKYVSGWKSRTASMPTAVDANATITLEGGCDLIADLEGKCETTEGVGDDTETEFSLDGKPLDEDQDSIALVEYPEGKITDTGWSLDKTTHASALAAEATAGQKEVMVTAGHGVKFREGDFVILDTADVAEVAQIETIGTEPYADRLTMKDNLVNTHAIGKLIKSYNVKFVEAPSDGLKVRIAFRVE